MVEVFSLLAAVGYASGQITAKIGTRWGDVTSGLLFGLVVGTAAVGALAAATVASWQAPLLPLALFAVAGIAGPGMGRVLAMRSARDVGTSVSVPVVSSVAPVLTSAAGVVLFSEVVRAPWLAALAVILLGVWLCVRGGSANREPPLPHGPAARVGVGVLAAAGAGASFSFSDVMRKFALEDPVDPVLGAFVGMVAALFLWSTVIVSMPRRRKALMAMRAPAVAWFGASGLLAGLAQIFLVLALETGDLTLVSPILASQPVIAVILASVFLRRAEQLRIGTAVGALAVFAGVGYLSSL